MHGLLLTMMLAAAPTQIAVMPLSASEGVNDKTAEAVSESIAAEVRKQPNVQVMTRQELGAVMTLERQKQLLGCQNDACAAEIAGALDVDRAVAGSVAKLGESWTVHLALLDARKAQALAHSDRRKKGSIDDVLDLLPGMVHELFSPMAATLPSADQAPAPSPPTTAAKMPSNVADVPWKPQDGKAPKLLLLTDGAGRYVAVVPFSGLDGPLFAGDAKALYLQRVYGGGSEGDKEFSMNFWDPRARAELEMRDGKYTLSCGRTEKTFAVVPEPKAAQLLKSAKLYDVRWQRRAYALARDDEGSYFFVDQAREPEGNSDFHLYVGEQGNLVPVQTRVLASDTDGDVLGTPDGKLKLSHRSQDAEWIQGQARRKLTYLDVQDNARRIYGQLGAYKGPLGTACDGLTGN